MKISEADEIALEEEKVEEERPMTEKEKKRKERQDKIDKELNEALKRKNALERERKRIQKNLSD